MAEYSFRIATLKPTLTYIPTPVVDADPNTLQCIVSKQTIAQYMVTTTAFVYSSTVAGLPWIPAASLGSIGTRWLVRYEASCGGSNQGFFNTIPAINLISKRTSPGNSIYASGEGGSLGSYSPEAARQGYMAGWFIFTSDGTDLEFRMNATSGLPTYYDGMMITAIPIATGAEAGKLIEAVDFFGSQLPNATVVDTTLPWVTVLEETETIINGGDCLVLASCEGVIPSGAGQKLQMRFLINGVEQKAVVNRITDDSRDKFPFVYESVHQLPPGLNTFRIEGGSVAGVSNKRFQKARIYVIYLFNFQRWTSARSDVAFNLPVNTNYPTWGPPYISLNITPFSTTGEYVLAIGNMYAQTTNAFGGVMARIYNQTFANPMHEYTAQAQVQQFQATGDVMVLSTVGCELQAGPAAIEYRLNQTAQNGMDATQVQISKRELILVGLTKKPVAIPTVTIVASDVTQDSESGTANTNPVGGIDTLDSSVDAEFTTMAAQAPPAGIPATHPRLWFYNNDRLARLKASFAANDAQWQHFIATKPDWHWWPYGLQYLVNPTVGTLAEAVAAVDACLAKPMGVGGGDLFENVGVFTGEYIKEAAMLYDWLDGVLDATRKQKLEDMMLGCIYIQNTQDAISKALADTGGWGVSAPRNNYHATIIKGIAYAGIALYGQQPTTWGFPWGTLISRHQFSVPFKIGTPPFFTDCYELFTYKMDNISMPVWSDANGGKGAAKGGGWSEGAHYGQRPWRDIPEIATISKTSGGKDYLTGHEMFRDRIYYLIFESLPHPNPVGNATIVDLELGDNTGGPVDPGADIGASHRISMMMCVEAYKGAIDSEYGQHWLQNDVLDSDGGVITSPGHDLLLYDASIPARNYNAIKTHWYSSGNGVVAMRNNWNPDATEIFMISQDCREEHTDHDQNAVQIFKGASGLSFAWDGYLLGDVRAGGGGNYWESWNHATYTLARDHLIPTDGNKPAWGHQRFADYNTYPNMNTVTGKITRQSGDNSFGYCQGDCSDAYRPIPQSAGETSTYYNEPKVNDVYYRDLVYLKAPNIVLIYDRVRLVGVYTDGPATAHWPWPRVQPALQGQDVVVTQGANRLFKRYVLPTTGLPAFGGVTVTGTKMGWFRENTTIPIPSGYGKLLTAIQVTLATTPSMVVTSAITSATMDGCSFTSSGVRYHTVFSNSQTSALPTDPFSYDVTKLDANDVHTVCNLKIGQFYFITETFVPLTGKYQYTLGESMIGFSADTGGVVTFTPAGLPGQNQAVINRYDTSTATDVTNLITTKYINELDTSGDAEGTTLVTLGNQVLVASDSSTDTEATILTTGVSVNDISGDAESTLLVVDNPSGGPVFSWTEKMIDVGANTMRPNADYGFSFFTPDPGDGILWNKVSDQTDDTRIYSLGPNATFAQATFGLSSPGDFIGRLLLIQYVLRTIWVVVDGSTAPKMTLAIDGLGLSVLAQSTRLINLQNIFINDYYFDPIPVNIYAKDFDKMRLVLSLDGTLGSFFRFYVSEIRVDVLSSKSSEKEIS